MECDIPIPGKVGVSWCWHHLLSKASWEKGMCVFLKKKSYIWELHWYLWTLSPLSPQAEVRSGLGVPKPSPLDLAHQGQALPWGERQPCIRLGGERKSGFHSWEMGRDATSDQHHYQLLRYFVQVRKILLFRYFTICHLPEKYNKCTNLQWLG